MFFDVLLDAFLDALKVFPFVFAIYIIIELIESREAANRRAKKIFTSRFSPIFGAIIGVVPQCGFSVVATKLYQKGYILVGTLIAVYFATSDEALPILLSRAVSDSTIWAKIGLLVGIKVVYAIIIGFIFNWIFSRPLNSLEDTELYQEASHDGCCHHDPLEQRTTVKKVLLHPLIHALKITLYIFIVNLAFGILVDMVFGEEAIRSFLASTKYLQPLLSAAIGLVPNCSSSVIITELFAENYLTLGGAIAGLTLNSGLGLAVLVKDKKNLKNSLVIIASMIMLSLILGYGVSLIELAL